MSEEVKREVQTWDPVEWLDRIINGEQTYTLQEVAENSGHYKLVPDNVEVIQKGTPLSQSRLNRMTDGISFSHNVIGAIAAEALRQAGLAHKNRQVDFEKRFLQGEATITGTPFLYGRLELSKTGYQTGNLLLCHCLKVRRQVFRRRNPVLHGFHKPG